MKKIFSILLIMLLCNILYSAVPAIVGTPAVGAITVAPASTYSLILTTGTTGGEFMAFVHTYSASAAVAQNSLTWNATAWTKATYGTTQYTNVGYLTTNLWFGVATASKFMNLTITAASACDISAEVICLSNVANGAASFLPVGQYYNTSASTTFTNPVDFNAAGVGNAASYIGVFDYSAPLAQLTFTVPTVQTTPAVSGAAGCTISAAVSLYTPPFNNIYMDNPTYGSASGVFAQEWMAIGTPAVVSSFYTPTPGATPNATTIALAVAAASYTPVPQPTSIFSVTVVTGWATLIPATAVPTIPTSTIIPTSTVIYTATPMSTPTSIMSATVQAGIATYVSSITFVPTATARNTDTPIPVSTLVNTPTPIASVTVITGWETLVPATAIPTATLVSTVSPQPTSSPYYSPVSTIIQALTNVPTPANTATIVPVATSQLPAAQLTASYLDSIIESFTPTITPTFISTTMPTLVNTDTPAFTSTPRSTDTPSGSGQATATPYYSPVNTLLNMFTNVPTAVNTTMPTPRNTDTPIYTTTPNATIPILVTLQTTPDALASQVNNINSILSYTPTLIPTKTYTYTITPTITKTYTYTITPTITKTFTNTITLTKTVTLISTITSTSTITLTSTLWIPPSQSYTATNTATITQTPTIIATLIQSWNQIGSNNMNSRINGSIFTYNNKLYSMCGYNTSNLNDIWSTSDLLNWTLVNSNAVFSKRQYSASIIYNNIIFVITMDLIHHM
jgi:hypothetical protein